MGVKRIVADIEVQDVAQAKAFYHDFLGLEIAMDMGWIATYASGAPAPAQVTFASEGGSGAPVPHLSIEVDNLDELHEHAQQAGFEITYPLTREPWGVRRFFVRDPFGKVINLLMHDG